MAQNVIALFLAATLGQFPGPVPAPGIGPGPGSSQYGGGAVQAAPNSTQAFGTGDPTYPYDYEPNWMHGYHQEIPAYGGHHLFRPYNFRHVLPQSQTAAAWGIPPQLPISHPNFNSINGVPPMPPPYHTGTYQGSTNGGSKSRSASEDILDQFSKIDNKRTASRTQPRRSAPQVAARSPNTNVVQARLQQPQRLSRSEE
jgi:hypothetical protein